MKCYVGIDLGSTTTKAVVFDEGGRLLGRGITNSRSNYDVACGVARIEAFINARFALFSAALEGQGIRGEARDRFVEALSRHFRREQHRVQQAALGAVLLEEAAAEKYGAAGPELRARVRDICQAMEGDLPELFGPDAPRRSDFFRDVATSGFMRRAEEQKEGGVSFDVLMSVFDKSIIRVENHELDLSFAANIRPALERFLVEAPDVRARHAVGLAEVVADVARTDLEEANTVGTGYGRSKLPFRKDQIRSEILCHGLGAHWMFPQTATVLDIGGQDTKAIQVDPDGIVTSFQMNDRCAAGCGRYLGYIADEMNLGVHELGPLAQQSSRSIKISSTCTVFAGAELRDRLTLGDKREDVLAGLHRAMILRAMSLLARSGGVNEQFTFTGGVAKNPAAVDALKQLVFENYGERTVNISPDSIYTGAIGAALFARRERVPAAVGAA
jgi:benzoyl-CoA reductase subunit A